MDTEFRNELRTFIRGFIARKVNQHNPIKIDSVKSLGLEPLLSDPFSGVDLVKSSYEIRATYYEDVDRALRIELSDFFRERYKFRFITGMVKYITPASYMCPTKFRITFSIVLQTPTKYDNR